MLKPSITLALLLLATPAFAADDMPAGWSKDISATQPGGRPDTKWFQDAKFGIFMHWGLYSKAANLWNGKQYYGSGEWLMNVAKIPAKDYEKLAESFNPTAFNADDYAQFVKDAGAQYLVITAKHHEGFAMFKSQASPFNIVDATPSKKDPLAALAGSFKKQNLHLGFYYSQFLDWHEPDGGGNTWDFDKSKKDILKYYAGKSMPQIRELASNYGPLGILWFDMPGGLTREQTADFIADIRKLQPNCLISSRVGQGLGDFKDLGDSELSPMPIDGPWEALFTHTDSWGYQAYDQNFKSPREILRLLASTAARGGNLLLNVGPDGDGRLPEKSVEYLKQVGAWLKYNGQSIYATTRSPFPDQPWGVATTKLQPNGGTLFLHILDLPKGNLLYVPHFTADVKFLSFLNAQAELKSWKKEKDALLITLPKPLPTDLAYVIQIDYTGQLPNTWKDSPTYISNQFDSFTLDSARAILANNAKLESKTSSRYFGNWKHDPVITSQSAPADTAAFNLHTLSPGDYRLSIEYACPDPAAKAHELAIDLTPTAANGGGAKTSFTFQTVATAPYDSHQPLIFYRHQIGIITLPPGDSSLTLHPTQSGPPLLWLRRFILEPVQ